MSIHKRIRARREALGLSMQELATMVGVSAWQTIQQWEKEGGTAPKRERLQAVATALQTTPEILLFGTEEERQKASQIAAQAIFNAVAPSVLSDDGLRIGKAFDQLNPAQKAAVIAQFEAFGVQLRR